MRALVWLERQPKPAVLVAALILVLLVGLTDFRTGTEIAFSVFYFIPIAAAAYFAGLRAGLFVAVVSGLIWMVADVLGGHTYSNVLLGIWNTLNRLISFVILAVLLGALRKAYDDQRELAHSDPLTGARNRRQFLERVEVELGRARLRHPLTIVHFDLDGFKAINDRLGHSEGDAVLRAAAEATGYGLRATDTVARLGGDEFAVLLPETGAVAARATVEKIQTALEDEMRKHEWPVTFSLGVLTCVDPPANSDELIRLVDALTYAAKTRGKNTAVYELMAGRPAHAG
jgi:diguanylate cyclase (GGDEF)-like protein